MSSANWRNPVHENQSGACRPKAGESVRPSSSRSISSLNSATLSPALTNPINQSRYPHGDKSSWTLAHDIDDLYSYQSAPPYCSSRSAPSSSSSSSYRREEISNSFTSSVASPLRSRQAPGPGLLEMSTTQHQSTVSVNSTKSSGGIKNLPFLKSHHHPNNEEATQQHSISISSNFHPKHSKSSSKTNKANKHGHHGLLPSSTKAPNAASFNAIFQCQPKKGSFHDERIMLEEWLHKRSSSLQMVWKRRWCVLRDDCLLYYRSDTDTKPLGVLHFADYPILGSGPDVSRKSKLVFRLSAPESIPREQQHHLFRAETPQALDLWLEALQGHIDHALNNSSELCRSELSTNDISDIQGRAVAPPGSFRYIDDGAGTESSGRSIIDKVLERLQIDDPTLSDMNDPSTLIMPAQEHPSPVPNQQQYPISSSFRTLQFCSEDENLDGWSSSPSPSVNLYSTTGTPIRIRGAHSGSLGHDHTHSASSILTDPTAYSSYSSYSDKGLSGTMSGPSRNRISGHALDFQSRTSMQQCSRGSQGFHSASSSLNNYQQQQQTNANSLSPRMNPQRFSRTSFPFDMIGAVSPSTTPISSPLSSPKMSTFSSSSRATAYAVPPSPRTLFYRADSELKRSDSNASLTSISTIDSCPDDGTYHDMAAVDELALIMEDLDQKTQAAKSTNNNSSNSSGVGSPGTSPTKKANRKYCTTDDLQSLQILEKRAKTDAASNGKKTKKLWSGYGGGVGSSSDKPSSSTSSSSIEGRSKKTISQSLDSSNPMLKGLILINLPSKKQNRDSHVSTKALSKSMTSLSKGTDQTHQHHQHAMPLPSPPGSLHLDGMSLHSSSPSSRTRSPSVSLLEDSLVHRPSVGDILSSRLSVLPLSPKSPPLQPDTPLHHRSLRCFNIHRKQSHPSLPRVTTAPVRLMSSGRRYVDHDVQQLSPRSPQSEHGYNYDDNLLHANVSRHIVAPDELAMALEKEDEERHRLDQQRQEQEQEQEQRLIQKCEEALQNTGDISKVVRVLSSVHETETGRIEYDTAATDIINAAPVAEISDSLEHEKDKYSSSPASPLSSAPPMLPKRSPYRSAPIILSSHLMHVSPK